MANRGLGKGLGALIPDKNLQDFEKEKGSITKIPLEMIVSNKNQPRNNFRKEQLNELAKSIKEFGVIQPIVVRDLENSDNFEIIAGERRFRASEILGLKTIPAIINKDIDDVSSIEIALIENIQRDNLSPIELSHTFKQLLNEFKMTHQQLSNRIGKKRTTITNILRLLSLPVEIQKLVDKRIISTGHARAILGLNKSIDQIETANLIIEKGLSVRDTEKLIKRKQSTNKVSRPKKPVRLKKLSKISREISRYLEALVKIKTSKRKGKIEIEFNSVDELERIVKKIIE